MENNESTTTFQKESDYDTTISRLLDLTIGRYNIAQIDPRNIGPFMLQCKKDVGEVLDYFVQRHNAANASSRHTSRPGSAFAENNKDDRSTIYEKYLNQAENNNNTKQQQDQKEADAVYATSLQRQKHLQELQETREREANLYKSLLQTQSNESAWKDMCSELVDELETNQAKSNEIKGQLERRETLLKEMRIAYYTEISHLKEMVRQFRTKGSCTLPEIQNYNWKDDSILSEQLIREQKQKHAQALEDERLRHQRELDLAYERYIKVNEHLRAQVTQLEREKRTKKKEFVKNSIQSQTSFKLVAADDNEQSVKDAAEKLQKQLEQAVELSPQARHNKDELDDDDDDSNSSGSHHSSRSGSEHEKSKSAITIDHDDDINEKSQIRIDQVEKLQNQQNPQQLRTYSGLVLNRGESPNNVSLSRMASNFDKQSNLSAPGSFEPSYPVTPVPQPPTPQNVVSAAQNVAYNTTVATTAKRIDSPLKTSPTTAVPGTKKTVRKPPSPTRKPTSTSTRKRSPSPTTSSRPTSARTKNNTTTISSGRNKTTKSSTTDDFLSRMSKPLQQDSSSSGHYPPAQQIQGVSEKTLTTLMDNHKRAMANMKAERDAAISRLNATKDQLALSLKKIEKLAADGQDREDEISDLRKRIEGGGDGSSAVNKNAVEIKATNLRLREELLKKNQILENRTKELVQLQEETARWFEAFRAVHPADRSPINYAVLERLAIAVQKAEKTEETYRLSTWSLMSVQLRHRSLLNKMKEEGQQLQQQQKLMIASGAAADSNTNNAANNLTVLIRKHQQQTELVFSQLWRNAARVRQYRAKCKQDANVSWDVVLFTARALVNHEDIAVVHEFTSLVNEPGLKRKDKNAFLESEADKKRRKEEEEIAKEQQKIEEEKRKRAEQNEIRKEKRKSILGREAIIETTNDKPRKKSPSFIFGDVSSNNNNNQQHAIGGVISIIGNQGVADVEELEQHSSRNPNNNRPSSAVTNNSNINSNTKINATSLMKRPMRPGSASSMLSSGRPQTPISALNDLRCLPLSQVPNVLPSASLAQVMSSASNSGGSGTKVRNIHSALHRRQQTISDLENKQRNVDEIRMRTLRYYSNHRSATISGASPSAANSAASTTAQQNLDFLLDESMHRTKLFGRNEDS